MIMHHSILVALAISVAACSGQDPDLTVLDRATVTSSDVLESGTELPELSTEYAGPIDHDLVRKHWLRGLGMARERGIDIDPGELTILYVEEPPCGWSGCYQDDTMFVRAWEDHSYQPGELFALYDEWGHRWNGDGHEVSSYLWKIAGTFYAWEAGDEDLAIALMGVGSLGTSFDDWWTSGTTDGVGERYERGTIGALQVLLECDGDLECSLRTIANASTDDVRRYLSISEDDFNDGPCALWQSLWFDILDSDGLPLDYHQRDVTREMVLYAC